MSHAEWLCCRTATQLQARCRRLKAQRGHTALTLCIRGKVRRVLADAERLQRWHRRRQLALWWVNG